MFKPELGEMDHCCSCYKTRCSCLNKENSSQQQEMSLYSAHTKNNCNVRQPLGRHDSNSRDSGFDTSNSDTDIKFFEFAKSLGVTPRNDCSPLKKSSFCSLDAMDEEFFDVSDNEQPLDVNAELPADFNTLINGTLVFKKAEKISPELDLNVRPLLRRSVSLNSTPNSSKVRSCLFRSDDAENKPFKRPDPPMELGSPVQVNKRIKTQENVKSRPYQRSHSATEQSIESALQRSSIHPDLIGDFSRCYCLPLITGKHPDLKCITATTLAAVVRGEYDEAVGSCTVVDCRYPYEYEGGHIHGAVNYYTRESITSLIRTTGSPPPVLSQQKRNILVFHCEFSSERGPTLYRFLRNLDRMQNNDYYPALYYPELYLLDGGYKGFYEAFPELCEPSAYLQMLHPAHQESFRLYRAQSKTYSDKSKTSGERSIGSRSHSFKRSSFM